MLDKLQFDKPRAEVMAQHQGEYLGTVGGRVLAEVILGLRLADPTAYLHAEPNWSPTLPSVDEDFRFADLLTAAGVADTIRK